MVCISNSRSLRAVVAVARLSRSKPGFLHFTSTGFAISKRDANTLWLAMTPLGRNECNLIYALGHKKGRDERSVYR